MPNIRSQSIDGNSITMTASDGRSITLTKEQIQTFYQGTKGNAAARREEVIAWVKDQITVALGPEQVPQSLLGFDLDPATGTSSHIEVVG